MGALLEEARPPTVGSLLSAPRASVCPGAWRTPARPPSPMRGQPLFPLPLFPPGFQRQPPRRVLLGGELCGSQRYEARRHPPAVLGEVRLFPSPPALPQLAGGPSPCQGRPAGGLVSPCSLQPGDIPWGGCPVPPAPRGSRPPAPWGRGSGRFSGRWQVEVWDSLPVPGIGSTLPWWDEPLLTLRSWWV